MAVYVDLVSEDDTGAYDPAEYRYVQVADLVAAKIADWAPGSRLPAEAELAEEYGVARMTMRRAMGVLRERGLVRTLHGRGTFVIKPDSEEPQP